MYTDRPFEMFVNIIESKCTSHGMLYVHIMVHMAGGNFLYLGFTVHVLTEMLMTTIFFPMHAQNDSIPHPKF